MGFGQVQFGGLASGLDTNAIISAILGVERIPILQLESRKEGEEGKISLIGTLEGLVKDLQTKAQELSSRGSFFAYDFQVGDESVLSAELSGTTALTGSHTIKVASLAAADRYSFDAATQIADPNVDTVGAGRLSFTQGGTDYSIDIGATDTLNNVASAINTAADGAVTASVVNVSTAANPDYKLVISSEQSGEDFAITGINAGPFAGSTNISKASNAAATVDGLDIERSTNVFDDVLDGVTFTATSVGTSTLGIDVDNAGTKENVKELVASYNEIIDFINDQSSFSEEDGAGGQLFGDRMLATVRSEIRGALFNVDLATVQADTTGFSTISLVGIDLEADGRLSIDDTVFDEKLAEDINALENLFSGEESGVFTRLDSVIEELLDGPTDDMGVPISVGGQSLDGLFDRRRTTLRTIIDGLDDDIERLEFRLESLEGSLVQRFANLESVIGGLNAQSAFLANGLGLPS